MSIESPVRESQSNGHVGGQNMARSVYDHEALCRTSNEEVGERGHIHPLDVSHFWPMFSFGFSKNTR